MIGYKSLARLFFIVLLSLSTYVYADPLYQIETDGKSAVTIKRLLAEPTTKELIVGKLTINKLSKNIKQIEIPLKRNLVVRSKMVSFDENKKDSVVWTGNILSVKSDEKTEGQFENSPLNYVTLVEANHRLTGIVSIKGDIYSIVPLNEKQMAVITIDSRKFPVEAEPITPDDADSTSIPTDTQTETKPPPANLATPSLIQIAFIFTPEARQAIGTENLLAYTRLAETLLRDNVRNSGLAIDFRLFPAHSSVSEGNSNFRQQLAELQNPNTPRGQEAANIRQRYSSQLVSLVTTRNEYCGIGYRLNGSIHHFRYFGFSGVNYGCASWGYTLPHEIGHNMGAQHNPENGTNRYFPFGYSFRFTGQPAWRTVMALECPSVNCVRINSFSSPNRLHNGIPMGSPTQDNTRVLDQTRHNAAIAFP